MLYFVISVYVGYQGEVIQKAKSVTLDSVLKSELLGYYGVILLFLFSRKFHNNLSFVVFAIFFEKLMRF